MRVINDQWVCVDCIMFLANGDLPDEPREDGTDRHWSDDDPHGPLALAILAGVEAEAPGHWVPEGPHTGEHAPECGECDGSGKDLYDDDIETCVTCDGTGRMDEDEEADTVSFSWGACDCCGSSLGGSRHRAAVLIPEQTHKRGSDDTTGASKASNR